MTVCQAPECGHEIKDGDRKLTLLLTVDWGADDIRPGHAKAADFHSFGCLSDWAAEKAADHDGHVLKEGV